MSARSNPLDPVELRPIGVVRTPFDEKVKAPRQPAAARGVRGRIELVPGMGLEHAVEDLAEWDHIWVIFLFHLNEGWKPKVLPPRSKLKRGVLATRSPHRPNPIGISAVRLESVDGLTLHVADVDMVDGTPVLDVKPYVPYADSIPEAGSGWLESPEDPEPAFDVAFGDRARIELEWLEREQRIEIRDTLVAALALGPEPHPYRRIKKIDAETSVIALKSWRARFSVEAGRRITVQSIHSGYGKRDLERGGEPEIEAHRAFVARFSEVVR